MYGKTKWILMVMLALLLPFGAASAGEARDLCAECKFSTNGKPQFTYKLLYNDQYNFAWETLAKKNVYLEVRLPEGETAWGVHIKWERVNKDWQIELKEGGEWVPYHKDETGFLSTYAPLPGVTEFRIAAHQRLPEKLRIQEMYVLSEGDLPDWVQVWEPTYEKADMLLVVAHPDDEYVFMGGLIPYYGAERGKNVLVAYITESTAQRRMELLDGLWTVGQRSYPLLGKFYDRYTTNLKTAYERLGEKKTKRYMVELFRHYKPEVVVTHDIKGEYGHGVHKLCADIVLNALERSADPAKDVESAEMYGVWDVPKAYLHLYPENEVIMNWDAPLSAFGGKTGFDMADAGFLCHLSQQETKYEVYRDGPYDSRRFGLVRSLVGPDVEKNDLFENIE